MTLIQHPLERIAGYTGDVPEWWHPTYPPRPAGESGNTTNVVRFTGFEQRKVTITSREAEILRWAAEADPELAAVLDKIKPALDVVLEIGAKGVR